VIGGAGNCGGWAILVGGPEADLGLGAPVLEALGRPHYLGSLGAGNSLKLLNNFMLTVLVSTAREMLALSRAAGIEPEVMCGVLSSTGSVTLSRFFTEVLPRVLEGDQAGNFSLGLLQKDAALALQLARDLEIDVPTLEAARQAIAAAGEHLAPSTDFTEILRRAAGASPR
jgi:3-hydroxyisobutyrate dehydrogenase